MLPHRFHVFPPLLSRSHSDPLHSCPAHSSNVLFSCFPATRSFPLLVKYYATVFGRFYLKWEKKSEEPLPEMMSAVAQPGFFFTETEIKIACKDLQSNETEGNVRRSDAFTSDHFHQESTQDGASTLIETFTQPKI